VSAIVIVFQTAALLAFWRH